MLRGKSWKKAARFWRKSCARESVTINIQRARDFRAANDVLPRYAGTTEQTQIAALTSTASTYSPARSPQPEVPPTLFTPLTLKDVTPSPAFSRAVTGPSSLILGATAIPTWTPIPEWLSDRTVNVSTRWQKIRKTVATLRETCIRLRRMKMARAAIGNSPRTAEQVLGPMQLALQDMLTFFNLTLKKRGDVKILLDENNDYVQFDAGQRKDVEDIATYFRLVAADYPGNSVLRSLAAVAVNLRESVDIWKQELDSKRAQQVARANAKPPREPGIVAKPFPTLDTWLLDDTVSVDNKWQRVREAIIAWYRRCRAWEKMSEAEFVARFGANGNDQQEWKNLDLMTRRMRAIRTFLLERRDSVLDEDRERFSDGERKRLELTVQQFRKVANLCLWNRGLRDASGLVRDIRDLLEGRDVVDTDWEGPEEDDSMDTSITPVRETLANDILTEDQQEAVRNVLGPDGAAVAAQAIAENLAQNFGVASGCPVTVTAGEGSSEDIPAVDSEAQASGRSSEVPASTVDSASLEELDQDAIDLENCYRVPDSPARGEAVVEEFDDSEEEL